MVYSKEAFFGSNTVFFEKSNPRGTSTISAGVTNRVTVFTRRIVVTAGGENRVVPGIGYGLAKGPFIAG
jgi:hypothetical protein